MSAGERFMASLRRAGRPMVIKRRMGTTPVFTEATVHGRARHYQPEELIGAVIQGDRRIRISEAELLAAGWPSPPRKGDILDGATVQGVEHLHDAEDLVGFVVWVRG